MVWPCIAIPPRARLDSRGGGEGNVDQARAVRVPPGINVRVAHRRRLAQAHVIPRDRLQRVLGVDGGQSGIRLRHSLGDRVVEVEGVSHQEGDTIAAVANAVIEGWRRGGFDPVDRVVLGLTTAPADADGCDRLCRLVGSAIAAPQVWLADDAVTSHAGALSLGWGVSIVAGTGVACLAVPEHGAARIIGGHGYLLGDEGGGFWIGRHGLRAVLRSADGRGPETSLAAPARRRFGSLTDLHVRLHAGDRPVNAIAQFAPDVLEAAEAGDAAATHIVDEAARELLLLARAGAAWAGGEAVTVPLALGGRLLEPGGGLRRRLLDLLAGARLPVAPRSADASALDGAVRLGRAGDPGTYGDLVHTWSEGGSA
jgi:glucosamine kinase